MLDLASPAGLGESVVHGLTGGQTDAGPRARSRFICLICIRTVDTGIALWSYIHGAELYPPDPATWNQGINQMRNLMNAISVIAFAMADEGGGGGGLAPGEIDPNDPAAIAAVNAVKAAQANGTVVTNKPIEPVTDDDKLSAIGKVLPNGKNYATVAEAMESVIKAGKETENFYGLPVIVKGYNVETDTVDETIYSGMLARVGTISARVEVNGKGKNGMRAITIIPIPDVDAVMNADGGKEFIARILSKEFAAVAYRPLRADVATEADLLAGIAKSPSTVADYITESKRAGSGSDTETFDTLWKDLIAGLKKNLPALGKVMPNKTETIKCIRSAAYAKSEQDEIENLPNGIGSGFVKVAQIAIAAAKQHKMKDGTAAPLDTAAIEDWIAGRDVLVLNRDGPREKDFSGLAGLDFGNFGTVEQSTTADTGATT